VIGSAIFYLMLAISGMFVPLGSLPRPWALLGGVLPMSHAVALLRGAWVGAGWPLHLGVLGVTTAICLGLTTRVFRWELRNGSRVRGSAGRRAGPSRG
jgi:ABC-type multidrug transport system permease subunit